MTRHEWIEDAQEKLEEWARTLNELERKKTVAKGEAEAKYHELLASARRNYGHARARVDKARDVAGDTWSDVKESVQEAWTEDKKAVEEVLSELKA